MEKISNVLKWCLIIGIVIVLNLFFNYALSVIYKAPQYNDICKTALDVQPTTQDSCVAVGGKWSSDVTPEVKNFNCDTTFTCGKTYNLLQSHYDRNVFIILVILGVATLIASFFLTSNLVIAYGLALGGVLSFIIASFRYWGSANDIIRLIILGVALLALIILAAKKFTKKKKDDNNIDYDRQV